jgi:hypothetical protein
MVVALALLREAIFVVGSRPGMNAARATIVERPTVHDKGNAFQILLAL